MPLKQTNISKGKIAWLRVLPALLIFLVWELSTTDNRTLSFFIGTPSGVFDELQTMWNDYDLFSHFVITLLEALFGFLAGTIIGTLIGLGLWFSKLGYEIAKPYLIVIGSVPVFALGPVLIFWFGTGMFSKVILAFLATLVIAIVQSYSGAIKTNPNLIALIKAFGGSKWQIFGKVVAPSSIFSVLTGIRLNIGMALLGAFIGEIISSRAGLGHLILVAEGLYNVNQIWVGILGIIIIALIFNLFTVPIEKWAKKYQ